MAKKYPDDESLFKYSRSHVLGAIDGLHIKEEFAGEIGLEDFPVNSSHKKRRKAKKIININEDSDASVDMGSDNLGFDEVEEAHESFDDV